MKLSGVGSAPFQPRRLTLSSTPGPGGGPPPPPQQPPDAELGEKLARWIGQGAQGLAMTPRFLESRPWILEKLNLQQAGPWLQSSAGLCGALGTVALASAGTMEVVDGVRHRNGAEFFSGASEVARAGYLGSWTAAQLTQHDWRTPVAGAGNTLSLISGGLQTVAGLIRMTHKKKPGQEINPKVVGLLEAGQGLTWVGSMVGLPVGLCFGLRIALSTGKAMYTHQKKWQFWTHQQ